LKQFELSVEIVSRGVVCGRMVAPVAGVGRC